jgi:hypothetical protein
MPAEMREPNIYSFKLFSGRSTGYSFKLVLYKYFTLRNPSPFAIINMAKLAIMHRFLVVFHFKDLEFGAIHVLKFIQMWKLLWP